MGKGKRSYLILFLLLVAGILLVSYPTISNYWNTTYATRVISGYQEDVVDLGEQERLELLKSAEEYNKNLAARGDRVSLTNEEQAEYEKQLSVSQSGAMGYIDIPAIRTTLPFYHGTDEAVLQAGVGHIEWSSLPVGGSSSHCLLSAHRGLPSAQLFTNLDKVVVGDIFTLHTLGETFAYEVDQILIVEPRDVTALRIEKGKDYCTLITCTPYAVNSHRLLVRGHRVDNPDGSNVIADAVQIEPMVVAPAIGIPLLAILLALLVAQDKRRLANRLDDLGRVASVKNI